MPRRKNNKSKSKSRSRSRSIGKVKKHPKVKKAVKKLRKKVFTHYLVCGTKFWRITREGVNTVVSYGAIGKKEET